MFIHDIMQSVQLRCNISYTAGYFKFADITFYITFEKLCSRIFMIRSSGTQTLCSDVIYDSFVGYLRSHVTKVWISSIF